MNLTIGKDQMLVGLGAVQNVAGSRSTLPILSNVLIRAENGRATFTATDLDVTISCDVSCTVTRPGSTTLPVKKLVGISREVAGTDIDLDTDEKHVTTLRSGPSFFKIRGLSAEEFPPIPQFSDERKINLPQDRIRSMLRRTGYAISTDESRYVLNGIFFSLKEHKLTLVATDGRRLALVDEEVEIAEKSQAEFIVPAKAVGELNRLLQDKGEATLAFSENQASFNLKDEKGQSVMLVTKLIEGSYPNYRQVIPSETKERVVLSRDELLHALSRAQIMTSDKQNSVRLNLTKNQLAITANSPDVGEARETMAVNYKGRDLAIAFNPGYLIDPLKALETDEVYLELIDELSPGVLKVDGPFLYVVMPMRLN